MMTAHAANIDGIPNEHYFSKDEIREAANIPYPDQLLLKTIIVANDYGPPREILLGAGLLHVAYFWAMPPGGIAWGFPTWLNIGRTQSGSLHMWADLEISLPALRCQLEAPVESHVWFPQNCCLPHVWEYHPVTRVPSIAYLYQHGLGAVMDAQGGGPGTCWALYNQEQIDTALDAAGIYYEYAKMHFEATIPVAATNEQMAEIEQHIHIWLRDYADDIESSWRWTWPSSHYTSGWSYLGVGPNDQWLKWIGYSEGWVPPGNLGHSNLTVRPTYAHDPTMGGTDFLGPEVPYGEGTAGFNGSIWTNGWQNTNEDCIDYASREIANPSFDVEYRWFPFNDGIIHVHGMYQP